MSERQTIVLATGNRGKLKEFQALLAALPFTIVPQSDFDVPAADETGLTFVENALLKARQVARHTGLPAIADDSGLEVDALNGAPGIRSARFAGAEVTDAALVDAANNAKLLALLDGVAADQRTARFRCALVLLRHAEDPAPLICQGVWPGTLLTAARGDGGFGYDPLFWVASEQATAAELPTELKNRISHRGLAMRELLASLGR